MKLTQEQRDEMRAEARERWKQTECALCHIKVMTTPGVVIDYMATPEAWAAAGLRPRQFACLGCFEDKLPGRNLTEAHLSSAVCNRLLVLCIRVGLTPWRV